ncbi:polysaccharide pyruvyl transferase family protein [Microbacterium sp. Gd 4-13]|uniref:polysaccharide pyruvyl transferase family protein n=1 Tax=Microbacterium sp. Gd 4-13 TaxID=2173179 RepID=UPI001402C23F|nr:polysaccharide pyruvyl transferase family protein [Microbacterium sp. Gd 4-13]
MSVIVIGDIGVVDGMMHIGDEAMFEAAATELSARGVDVVGVSSAPDESAARYGVGAVPRLGFAGLDRAAAAARSELLVAAASGRLALPTGDPATAVVEAVQAATGVLVAGGGNLASRWPVHIHERGTLAAMARSLGLPVVVSGQTLGPDLIDTDAAAVRELLGTAALAAVREPTSAALAASWDVPVRLGVDDASFLGGDGADERSGIVVSVSGWFDHRPPAEVEASIARLIDHAASVVGGPVRFHAHFGPLDADAEPRGDAALHERIRAHLTAPSEVVPTGDSLHSAALARSAALLITSRYHPAVFAAPAGVPTLGLVADAYTQIKLSGVLGHWGEPATATLDELDTRARTLVEGLDAARPRIRDEADARRPAHRAAYTAWWDDVAGVLAP